MSARRIVLCFALASLFVSAVPGCGRSAEGESCDRANVNEDCEDGLICRPAFEVRSSTSVCCPRPPARASVAACKSPVEEFEPDASAGGGPSAGGTSSTGGAAGSAGAAGSGGSGGSSGGSAGTAGSSGSAGAAGSSGSAGAAGSDAGVDASDDAPSDGATD